MMSSSQKIIHTGHPNSLQAQQPACTVLMVYIQQTVEQQLLPVLDEHLHLQHLGGPLAPLHLAGPAHKLVYLDGWLVLQELLPDLDEHHLHLHLLGHLAPHLGGPAHELVFYLDDWWLVLQEYSGSGLGYKDNHHLCVQDDTQEHWKNCIGGKYFWGCRIFLS